MQDHEKQQDQQDDDQGKVGQRYADQRDSLAAPGWTS